MAKTASISILLVPESEKISKDKLKKEIMESLNCDWLMETLKVEIVENNNPDKVEEG
jgi:hypothetical protein